ncbi:MAG: hypothetical protein AAF496_15460, partial [Pseudomonadota bacterium]
TKPPTYLFSYPAMSKNIHHNPKTKPKRQSLSETAQPKTQDAPASPRCPTVSPARHRRLSSASGRLSDPSAILSNAGEAPSKPNSQIPQAENLKNLKKHWKYYFLFFYK